MVDTGRVEDRFIEYLEKGFKTRHAADYQTDLTTAVSIEDAEESMRKATEFVGMAEQFLKGAGGKVEQ